MILAALGAVERRSTRVSARGQAIRSAKAALTSGLDLEGAENLHGGDGLSGEFGSHIERDAREAEHLNMQRGARIPRGFEVAGGIVRQAEAELLTGDRLLHRIALTVELIAHRRPDEIGTVGIESIPNQ